MIQNEGMHTRNVLIHDLKQVCEALKAPLAHGHAVTAVGAVVQLDHRRQVETALQVWVDAVGAHSELLAEVLSALVVARGRGVDNGQGISTA